ncbi:MAG: ATP-dependent DNA helicase RecG [Myxococcaceae bacterium]
MAPAANPFADLLGPLKYACQHRFAQLSTVRGLRAILEKAIEGARALGADAVPTGTLERELGSVDSASLEERKASLRRVLAALRDSGLELPDELLRESFGEAGALLEPAPDLALSLPLFAGAAAREAQEPEPEPEQESPPMEAPPQEKPRGRKKKASAEEEEEAKVISIAPRDGPLATPLKSIGWRLNPRLLGALAKKGIQRVGDVLFLLPRAYEDRRRMRTIAELVPGERGVTVGEVKLAGEVPQKGGRRRTFRAVIADHTGSIAATFFQTGPWLKLKFPLGKRVVLSGEVRAWHQGREIPHPEVEPADDAVTSPVHFNRLVPIYPGFERHEQRALRDLAFKIADQYALGIEEPLPEALRGRLGLMGLGEALKRIHFPLATDDLAALDRHTSPAHHRLAFDELFFLQLGIALKRQGVKAQPGIAIDVSASRVEKARALLPFELTRAQAKVVKEICRDQGRAEPMNRLLQGDVGSGKTAVAVIAAALALQDGYQVAVMAPTEILAEQHHRTFGRLLGPLGSGVGLLTAGGTASARRAARAAVASGETGVAIGTHALIQEGVDFQRLGLVVIDEQHRFGVIQRHALMEKGVRPDVLVMTATPIPRTLAMTLYGDLEVSLIDELPPGRTPIATRVYNERSRPKVYEAMAAELAKGHQAYVVYPLVEESENVDLSNATQGAKDLQVLFPGHQVGLLHGRLKADEKERVMEQFRSKRLQILVCTTVVEVGVDVANASMMVIEAAERFGLSQLHQLRGRVGRGAAASFCFLVASYARSRESSERLAVMEKSNDGFDIAEKDLELRGPGEFLGTRQSGMPELAVANLVRDQALLAQAREEARAVLAQDPRLEKPEDQGLVKALEERWEGRLALARVG